MIKKINLCFVVLFSSISSISIGQTVNEIEHLSIQYLTDALKLTETEFVKKYSLDSIGIANIAKQQNDFNVKYDLKSTSVNFSDIQNKFNADLSETYRQFNSKVIELKLEKSQIKPAFVEYNIKCTKSFYYDFLSYSMIHFECAGKKYKVEFTRLLFLNNRLYGGLFRGFTSFESGYEMMFKD